MQRKRIKKSHTVAVVALDRKSSDEDTACSEGDTKKGKEQIESKRKASERAETKENRSRGLVRSSKK